MGSDTTQDVVNALSGFNFGINYPAINSGAATGYKHIISFDAAPAQTAGDNCVTPVINGPTFTRPNGSGAGRKSLYAASGLSAAGWLGGTFTLDSGTILPTCTAAAVNINGAVQFARSSSVEPVAGADVVFVPFGGDAVTFASYRPDGLAAVTTLTRKNLIDAYAGATRVSVTNPAGGANITIIPCGIQTNSGTMQFFRDTVTQSNAANEAAAVTQCTNGTTSPRLQESKGDLLKQRCDALVGVVTAPFVCISGYSAAAYIAQANGVSSPNSFNLIQIGSISDDSLTGVGGANLGSPTSGTAPNLTPNATFYASAGFHRDVYNVIRRSNLVNVGTGNLLSNAYAALFATSTSKVCLSTATINAFGFSTIPNCGDYTTTTRAWTTGIS
jgi:hypothetical protein